MRNELILTGEEMYSKIEKLKKIKVDSENWLTYFVDEITNEKWIEEYPEAEYHGGGRPILKLIKKFPWDKSDVMD